MGTIGFGMTGPHNSKHEKVQLTEELVRHRWLTLKNGETTTDETEKVIEIFAEGKIRESGSIHTFPYDQELTTKQEYENLSMQILHMFDEPVTQEELETYVLGRKPLSNNE